MKKAAEIRAYYNKFKAMDALLYQAAASTQKRSPGLMVVPMVSGGGRSHDNDICK